MDISRSAPWTRRRFGLVSSLLAAAAFGLHDEPSTAKKKKKKKCLKEDDLCTDSLDKRCCKGLHCGYDPDFYGPGYGGARVCMT